MAKTGNMQTANESRDPGRDLKSVRLSGRDIDDATRLLSLLAVVANERVVLEPPARTQSDRDSEQLLQQARDILARRSRRTQIFGSDMFGEHAWEMLLLLYTLQGGARQTISRLAELSGASRSTAMRWLNYLESRELVRREAHPTDRRTAFVEITAKGKERLELYLSELPVTSA